MIREATESDLAHLMLIETRSFTSDMFSEALYLSFLLRPDTEVYLEKDAGTPVSSAVLLFDEDDPGCHIVSLAVHPDYQGQGYGRKMMAFIEERARQRGRESLRLEVRADNQRARDLYAALQYHESGLLADFYGDGIDGVRYVKPLR